MVASRRPEGGGGASPTQRIVGGSGAIVGLRRQVERLATFDVAGSAHVPTILLSGETGTGKGLVAQVLHELGPRRSGPFVDVNCAAIPETMLEAELFGFQPGAFTDARRAKPGLFEAASGGSLFLDDVDSLFLGLQAKLLKAIEEKRIRRLGSVEAQEVDVKLVAATQMDLAALAREGTFRSDLYHRLAVVVLRVPPLRERGEDVWQLARHFLDRYAEAYGEPPKGLSRSAERWLARQPWSGNVRELAHLMERAILLAPEPVLDEAVLEGLRAEESPASSPPVESAEISPTEPEEATAIRQALEREGGNVTGVARRLGLSRTALRYRMRRYGIERPRGLRRPVRSKAHPGPAGAAETTNGGTNKTAAAVLRDLGINRPRGLDRTHSPFPPRAEAFEGEFRWPGRLRHNLPAQRSSFIGREREIREVRAHLAQRRLVTLTGVGGSGKTRLAIEVAVQELEHYSDGVFFVDLSSLTDGSLIPRTVAGAMDLPLVGLQADAAKTTVIEFLKKRVVLLLLDNCEHLIGECADFVDKALESCPKMTILATSREALDVEGEQLVGVPSLSLPKPGTTARESEAVELFVKRARDVDPGFDLRSSNEDSVVKLCRCLDGIPLALELAASRASHMSPADITSRLDDRFRLLTGGRHRRVQRHQTLQAAVDWSYDLLGEEEKTFLRRLSVFSGGFTLRMVEGICMEGLRAPALDLLGSLVSKSLVVAKEQDETTRCRLLETIRLYAAERLVESGEAETYRRRHRDWFLEWVEKHSLDDLGFRLDLAEILVREISNFRAALDWSEMIGEFERAARLAVALVGVWSFARHQEEGYRRLRKLTLQPGLDPSLRARCLTTSARVALQNGDWGALGEQSLEALEVDPKDDLSPVALSLHAVFVAVSSEDLGGARRLQEESFQRARERGQTHQARVSRALQAELEVGKGRYREAIELVKEMLPQEPAPSLDDFLLRVCLAGALLLTGDAEGAWEQGRLLETCDPMSHAQVPFGFIHGRLFSAEGAAELGEYDEARRNLAEATRVQLERPYPLIEGDCAIGFAVLSAAEGDPERTLRLLQTVVSTYGARGFPFRSRVSFAVYQRYRDGAERALDPETLERARTAGRSMTVEQALRDELERAEEVLDKWAGTPLDAPD